MAKQNEIPKFGFLLTNWGEDKEGYRATAHAYLKSEGLHSIEHKNGRRYTIDEIERAMLIYNKKV